ncbi:MAG: YggS family pyridoxal phosphate-dependent enzyme [Ornithinibacter sp.]
MSTTRREELSGALSVVRERIAAAAVAAGQDPEHIDLVVVTKYFPASDVDLLAELGVTAVGENRDQEAAAKCAELVHRGVLSVHFIGQLQSNKAASVVRYADVVQSVDRIKLVRGLDRACEAAGRRLDVLVQVGLDGSGGRGGADPEEVPALAAAIADSSGLHLRGVMAVAPLGSDARVAFDRLRDIADGLRVEHPEATWMSAGMSGDLEAAVAAGATHLRVGSAILGSRPPHR